MKLLAVVGARPNFVKIAPLVAEVSRRGDIEMRLVHTGQHYDERMSGMFFEELAIRQPDVDLGVGSGSQAMQTAEIIRRLEPVFLSERPDVVVVVGDVTSTLAAAITAAKMNLLVAHVEAGLRSFDRTMPEEVNRIMVDSLSRWLFVSEPSGVANLKREGVEDQRVFFVGNVMIDTLMANRAKIEGSRILLQLELAERQYAVLTLHRPANVDDPDALAGLFKTLERIAADIPIVFPVHPRTRVAMNSHAANSRFRMIDPLGYLDFMKLVSHAQFVLTDSGGVQEESSVLGVPCLTLRDNTERPITLTEGTNVLVGRDETAILTHARAAMNATKQAKRLDCWDGRAAGRIVDVLSQAASD
jgi:UDP-N-acetylglucosamine 2-epimerase (non-hydrolysing)